MSACALPDRGAVSGETALALARDRISEALAARGDGGAALTVGELAALARAAAAVARAEAAVLGERRRAASAAPDRAEEGAPELSAETLEEIGRRLYGIGA